MKIKKILSEEKGAVTLIEGAYIFPIVFLLIFFLLFLSFLFYKQIESQEVFSKAIQIPISSKEYIAPDEKLLREKWTNQSTTKVHGTFFKQLELSWEENYWTGTPFRFFKLPEEIREERKQKVRWSSSTENLRHYMAIKSWMKKKQ